MSHKDLLLWFYSVQYLSHYGWGEEPSAATCYSGRGKRKGCSSFVSVGFKTCSSNGSLVSNRSYVICIRFMFYSRSQLKSGSLVWQEVFISAFFDVGMGDVSPLPLLLSLLGVEGLSMAKDTRFGGEKLGNMDGSAKKYVWTNSAWYLFDEKPQRNALLVSNTAHAINFYAVLQWLGVQQKCFSKDGEPHSDSRCSVQMVMFINMEMLILHLRRLNGSRTGVESGVENQVVVGAKSLHHVGQKEIEGDAYLVFGKLTLQIPDTGMMFNVRDYNSKTSRDAAALNLIGLFHLFDGKSQTNHNQDEYDVREMLVCDALLGLLLVELTDSVLGWGSVGHRAICDIQNYEYLSDRTVSYLDRTCLAFLKIRLSAFAIASAMCLAVIGLKASAISLEISLDNFLVKLFKVMQASGVGFTIFMAVCPRRTAGFEVADKLHIFMMKGVVSKAQQRLKSRTRLIRYHWKLNTGQWITIAHRAYTTSDLRYYVRFYNNLQIQDVAPFLPRHSSTWDLVCKTASYENTCLLDGGACIRNVQLDISVLCTGLVWAPQQWLKLIGNGGLITAFRKEHRMKMAIIFQDYRLLISRGGFDPNLTNFINFPDEKWQTLKSGLLFLLVNSVNGHSSLRLERDRLVWSMSSEYGIPRGMKKSDTLHSKTRDCANVLMSAWICSYEEVDTIDVVGNRRNPGLLKAPD